MVSWPCATRQRKGRAMGRLADVLHSRVALAIMGLFLFGAAGTVVAVTPVVPQMATTVGFVFHASTPTGAPLASDPTTTVDSATATATASPDRLIPTPRPTATRAPIPTLAPGQSVQLAGRITSVNASANSFAFRSGGVTYTMLVNAATTFEGGGGGIVVRSFADLRPNMSADVTANGQTGATALATHVNAQGIVDN